MTTVSVSIVKPRLMRLSEAAIYLGMTPKEFLSVCQVAPIDIGTGRNGHRYDAEDLDKWLETVKRRDQSSRTETIMGRL